MAPTLNMLLSFGLAPLVAGDALRRARSLMQSYSPVCADMTLANGDCWHSAYGEKYDCEWFRKGRAGKRCREYGHYSKYGWLSASEACCACGGGMPAAATPAPTNQCFQTSFGAMDRYGHTCAVYARNPGWCTDPRAERMWDDEDFSHGLMCCACGGGTTDPGVCMDKTLQNGNPWHSAYGEKYDCEWFGKGRAGKRCSEYGSYSKHGWLSANEACCVCGGGMLPATPEVLLAELRALFENSSAAVLGEEDIQSYDWEAYSTSCTKTRVPFIVRPATEEDVSLSVRFARERGLRVSVRGSGHSYNCNAWRPDSLNLDMRSMGNAVSLEQRADGYTHATMAPGVTNRDVIAAIGQNPLSATLGTCPSVGIMGYTLHGGWSAQTPFWANESVTAMRVVTADGSILQLDSSSQGQDADLFRAMRVAGSSFGIAVSLTIRLFNHPFRPYLVLARPDNATFEEILATVPDEAEFGWVGLSRWDSLFFLPGQVVGSGWLYQIVPKDGSQQTLLNVSAYIQQNGLRPVTPDMAPFGNTPQGPDSYRQGDEGGTPFPVSGMFSRSYPLSVYREKAILLSGFFEAHAADCRFNAGPLKGEAQLPIVTVECNTPSSLAALELFVDEHSEELMRDEPGLGYVNLPLDSSRRDQAAFWPQYDELSAIKRTWDPDDFFYIENGIHP